MNFELVTALTSAGTFVVVAATAIAAFVQLRHLSVTNQLAALNDFRQEYERVHAAAAESLPNVRRELSRTESRRALSGGSLEALGQLMPLMRLLETLGSYTTRKIVSADLVCDLWSPVIWRWWLDCEPLIAVLRRSNGPTLFENWEAIAILSKRSLDADCSSYPRSLPRFEVEDPWAEEDGGATPAMDASARRDSRPDREAAPVRRFETHGETRASDAP